MHFLLFVAIFALTYFGVCLPLFQAISKKQKGRKFIIRLGTPWKVSDPDHRWDVVMSFISFMIALAISLYLLDLVFPLDAGALITEIPVTIQQTPAVGQNWCYNPVLPLM